MFEAEIAFTFRTDNKELELYNIVCKWHISSVSYDAATANVQH